MELTDFPYLAHLNATQAENLRAACEEQEVAKGEDLIKRGSAGGTLYFILEGELEVYVNENGRDHTLTHVQAPAVLGELELLTGKPRTASVRANTPVRALAVSHERLQSRIDDGDPAVLKAMFGITRVIAARLVAMSEKLVELESKEPAKFGELRDFREKLFSDWTV